VGEEEKYTVKSKTKTNNDNKRKKEKHTREERDRTAGVVRVARWWCCFVP
jgi:hypothetical protein